MILLLQAAPLVAIALCALIGIDPLRAVLVALGLALVSAAVSINSADLPSLVVAEVARGAWLAISPITITLAGLLFHATVSARAGTGRGTELRTHAALFDACLLRGSFFETITGFSVGVVFALGDLRLLGVTGSLAGALSLFSQVLIPWGGLGPGTAIGAALAGVDPARLGAVNAWLSAVWLVLLLAPLWRLARHAGLPASPRDKAESVLTVLALGGLLITASRFVGIEAAGLLAIGPVLAWRLRKRVRDARAWRAALPYLVLSGVLIATRLVPPLETLLVGAVSFRPWHDLPGLAPLHHPASVVLAVTLPFLFGLPARHALVLAALRRAVTPCLLFLGYGALARLLGGSGAAAAVAQAASTGAGVLLLLLVPLFGAAGGFFTGTNVGSNALLMPIQTELATSLGLPVVFVAAVQNFTGSAFCLVAPMRLGATAVLASKAATAGAIGRLIWPAAALALAVAAAAVLIALRLPWR